MALSLEDGIENSVDSEKEEVQSTAITNFVDDGKVPVKSNPELLKRCVICMTSLQCVYIHVNRMGGPVHWGLI